MTKSQAKQILNWAVQKLKLNDWQIDFYFSKTRPPFIETDCDGMTMADHYKKQAIIWVENGEDDKNIIDSICHEAVEVLYADCGQINVNESAHVSVYRFAEILTELYLKRI